MLEVIQQCNVLSWHYACVWNCTSVEMHCLQITLE